MFKSLREFTQFSLRFYSNLVLSIFSWQQWHYYRTENANLRLTADKYRVDSIILRELYPQIAITLSAYEHITVSEGAEAAIEIFGGRLEDIKNKSH